MEQGLANELVGRAKGTLRKVINWRQTPQTRGLFCAPQGEHMARHRVAADGGEKTRCVFIASAGAARIEAGEGARLMPRCKPASGTRST